MTISRDVGDSGSVLPRNRARRGRSLALRVAAASGIRAKSGSLLLRREDFSAHVCARVACPAPAITTYSSVFRHLRNVLTTGRGDGTPRAIRSRFSEQVLRCPGEKSDFLSFAIKRSLSTCPCGGPYDASRVCGGARLSVSLSHTFVSRIYSPFLSLRSLSFSHSPVLFLAYSEPRSRGITTHFCAVVEKKSIYPCANLLRVPSVRDTLARRSERSARVALFPPLRAFSPIADWIVIGYNRRHHRHHRRCQYYPPLFPEIFTTLLSFSIMERAMVARRWSCTRLAHCGLTR